jgi:hypothetical protein
MTTSTALDNRQSGSSTMVVEPENIYLARLPSAKDMGAAASPTSPQRLSNGAGERSSQSQDQGMTALPPPSVASEVAQRWNYPRTNIPKVAACFWSFVIMGANDAAYGVSVPTCVARWMVTHC